MDNFEKFVAEKLQDHQVAPSDKVMENIFSKRTRGYILMNHLRINRMRYAAAVVVAAGLVALLFNGYSDKTTDAGVKTAADQQQSVGSGNENSSNGMAPSVSGHNTNALPDKMTASSARNDHNAIQGQSNTNTSFTHSARNNRTVTVSENRYAATQNTYSAHTGAGLQDREDILYVKNAINIDEINVDEVFNYFMYRRFRSMANQVPPFESDVRQVALAEEKKNSEPTQRHKPLYIDVMYSPYWAQKHYGNESDMSSEFDLSYRYAQSATLRFSYPVYKGLMVQMGISSTRIAENYRYTPASPDRYRIDEVKQYIIDPTGPVIVKTTYDTVRYKVYGAYGKNVQTQYSVPVGLSHVFNLGSKLNASVNAGAVINMVSGGKGIQYKGQEGSASYNSKNKTDFSMGYYLGGTFSYQVAPRWSVLAEPNMRFTKLAGASNGIANSQYYYLYGSAFGVRYTW